MLLATLLACLVSVSLLKKISISSLSAHGMHIVRMKILPRNFVHVINFILCRFITNIQGQIKIQKQKTEKKLSRIMENSSKFCLLFE